MRSEAEPRPRGRDRPGRRGFALRVLAAALCAYLGAGLAALLLQSSMIFPGSARQGLAGTLLGPAEDRELLALATADGEPVAALFGAALGPGGAPHADARSRPTVLYFYGNGMCMADCMAEFDALRALENNVVLCDYPGFGMSGGKPSEAGCFGAAEAVWSWVLSRPDLDPAKIVPVGWSLGASSALHLAATRPVAAVAILSPFTSMLEMAQRALPWLPTSLLLRHPFDNERMLDRATCPVLIAHGTRDALVPFEMAQRLAERAGARACLAAVEGADHNDFFAVGGAELFGTIGRFVDRSCGP